MKRGNYIQKAALMMFIICAISGLASASWATTYYVSPSGSNASNGTSSTTPYLTIQQALNTVKPGDTVNIMAGTYNESLNVTRPGTSGNIITIQNYNGASVTINSGTSRTIYSSTRNIAYYTFSGLNLTCTYQSQYNASNVDSNFSINFANGNWWGDGVTNDTTNPQHITMQNCNIYGAIIIMGSYNTVTHCSFNGGGLWMDGVYSNTGISNHNTFTYNTAHGYTWRFYHGMGQVCNDVVNYNTIYDCGYSGNAGAIDFDGQWMAGYNNTANYNTIYGGGSHTVGTAIDFENGINSQAIGNTIYNVTSAIGFISYGLGSGVQSSKEYRNTPANNIVANNAIANVTNAIVFIQCIDNFVYNNSIYNASGYVIDCTTGGIDTTHYAGGQIIKNNVFSSCPRGLEQLVGSTPNTIDHNIFYNSSSTGTNVITGNPNFVNTGATPPNLSIGSGSAAIKAGLSISAVTTDILGNPRPLGSAYDIGAYQYTQVAAVQLSPPTGLTVQ